MTEPTSSEKSTESIDSCCGAPLSWESFERVDYHGKTCSCSKCKSQYELNGLTGKLYVNTAGNFSCFTHVQCAAPLQVVERVHSIWERGTERGWGEVVRELIPYCPECEEKPSERGNPVFYKPIIIRDGAVDVAATDGWEK